MLGSFNGKDPSLRTKRREFKSFPEYHARRWPTGKALRCLRRSCGIVTRPARQVFDDVGKSASHHSLKVVIAGSIPAIVTKFDRRKLTPKTTDNSFGGGRFSSIRLERARKCGAMVW